MQSAGPGGPAVAPGAEEAALARVVAAAPVLAELADWAGLAAFVPVPGDWVVLVADVRGSRAAVRAGRYRDVNTVGAACVVAAANACASEDFPFSFGGDGACVVLPPGMARRTAQEWSRLQGLARRRFGLELRSGQVPVQALRARGADLRIARQPSGAGIPLTLFGGGGLALAERLVKGAAEAPPSADDDGAPRVDGLECRWNDVPSGRGSVVTLLVAPRPGQVEALRPVLLALQHLLPGAMPVRRDNLPLSWPPRQLGAESALKAPGGLTWRLRHAAGLGLSLLAATVVRATRGRPGSAAARYLASLLQAVDHVRYDDVLRAVLDLDPVQARSLEGLLQRLHAEGRLDYGLHHSDRVHMTCFVRTLSRHLHFVDGGDGGYFEAALRLDACRAAVGAPTGGVGNG